MAEMLLSSTQLSDAITILLTESRLSSTRAANPSPPPLERAAFHRWLDAVLQTQHVESVRGDLRHADVGQLLRTRVPLIVRTADRFLILLGANRVLDADCNIRTIDRDELHALLCSDAEASVTNDVDAFLDRVGVKPRRRAAARDAMLRAQIGNRIVGTYWELRRSVAAPLREHLRGAIASPSVIAMLAVQLVEYALWVAAWTWGSRAALSGSVDRAWLLGWMLVLASIVPVRMLVMRLEGMLALRAADFLKRRLLVGALRLDPDELRASGVGELVGHASEADAFETVAHAGAILGILSIVELLIAATLLGSGAGGFAHAAILIAWVLAAGFIAWRYYRVRQRWADGRIAMTHDMIETMLGQRTRVAQQSPDAWHSDEDRAVREHLQKSRRMDRAEAALIAMPSVWTVIGIATLAPALLAGNVSTSALVASVACIVLATVSLGKLTNAAPALADAAIVWRQIASMFHAAERPGIDGIPAHVARPPRDDGGPVLTASDIAFAYPARASRPVLSGCTLTVHAGDRILLDAPSGSGKSTLLSILTGLRRPTSGVLLLNGVDLHTFGESEWRRRAAAAPQFHDNHVHADTLAFNLLMGRQWPPTRADFEEADAVCRELGLGELLDRMPSGLLQMVGDAGWQMSHGEKSRLYVARALLQDAELVALDESFAALDPANFQRCVEAVSRRARALILVAHP